MGKELSFILFFILIISFIPVMGADVISLNSGGSGNIIINPDTFIEGFFSGEIAVAAPVFGNSIIETGEQCDDGNTVSGDGCSGTCQTEVGEGEGGGEGAGIPITITVDPEEFNLRMAISTSREEIIRVTNTGITQIINPYGKIVSQLKPNEPGILIHEIYI